ncbi:hypothetical protein CHARACLAT_018704 [Characodon lateralis]|uniref:Uncharacterized protein n=1 Tax=Characodon lateralis TaxID=208331 RepID=A0ABU7EAR5_9TELE|nr:hypothetical protein [Characodon lateralis]
MCLDDLLHGDVHELSTAVENFQSAVTTAFSVICSSPHVASPQHTRFWGTEASVRSVTLNNSFRVVIPSRRLPDLPTQALVLPASTQSAHMGETRDVQTHHCKTKSQTRT